MPDRASTVADVERVTANWNLGIGPDQLHDALGWTSTELERYQAIGELPEEADPLGDGEIEEDHTFTTYGDNPFVAGVELPEDPEPLTRLQGVVTETNHARLDFWVHYTRWRALPTGDGHWKIMGEHGQEDTEGPRRHDNYDTALRRSDALNSAEQETAINREGGHR